MIKILSAQYIGVYSINCDFSDETTGVYDLKPLLFAYETALTVPLRDFAHFKNFFLRSGALCWKNGLELDPLAIYQEMEQVGTLYHSKKAA
jgi:Protein of unknown function (DUF2442)